MAAITRKPQSIFGSALVPVGNLAVWGSLKDGAAAYSNDPSVIQSAEWQNGLNGALIGNRSPAQEDLNALFYLLTYQLAYILQNGAPEWDANTTYWKGQLCRVPGMPFLAASLTDNNTNHNPAVDSNNWDLTPLSTAIHANTNGQPDQVVPMDGSANILKFGTVAWNPGNKAIYNAATGVYTAPIAGLYSFKCNLQIDNVSTSQNGLDGFLRVVDVGGGGYHIAQGWGQNTPPGARWYPLLAGDIPLTAGQQVAIYLGGTLAGAGNVSVSNSFLSISRVP
jgi:hypothetical protein